MRLSIPDGYEEFVELPNMIRSGLRGTEGTLDFGQVMATILLIIHSCQTMGRKIGV